MAIHHARRALIFTVALAGSVAGAGIGPARACQGCEPPRLYDVMPNAASPAAAPTDNSDALMVAGLGAIAGVVAFNFATGGTAALPLLAGAGTGAMSATEGAVAVSRVYAVTSAVAGALLANWYYQSGDDERIRAVPQRLAARLNGG